MVFVVAIVSELRTESRPMLLFTSADPNERRAELGMGEGGVIEGGRDVPLINMSDIAVVMVSDEEDMDEAEEGEGVVVGSTMGFKTRSTR